MATALVDQRWNDGPSVLHYLTSTTGSLNIQHTLSHTRERERATYVVKPNLSSFLSLSSFVSAVAFRKAADTAPPKVVFSCLLRASNAEVPRTQVAHKPVLNENVRNQVAFIAFIQLTGFKQVNAIWKTIEAQDWCPTSSRHKPPSEEWFERKDL